MKNLVGSPGNKEIWWNGCITDLRPLIGKSNVELEDALGFSRGAFGSGYWLYRLAEPLSLDDFDWLDRTKFSDGWQWRNLWTGRGWIYEAVPRKDLLRALFGKKLNYNEEAVDRALLKFKVGELEKINIGCAIGKIVKIFPKNRNGISYPDSEYWNIPQWKILGHVTRRFVLVGEKV